MSLTAIDSNTALIIVNAMTDTRSQAHDYSIANVFPRLGATGTTRASIDLLETRAA